MSGAVAIGCAAGYVVLLAAKLAAAWRRLPFVAAPRPGGGPESDAAAVQPTSANAAVAHGAVRAAGPAAVVVLQPILGGDPALGAVLADDLAALPDVRFLWLVDDDDAPGTAAAVDAARGAGERVRVLSFPTPPPGVNPKTFKLARAMAAVTEPVVLVLDDDARLDARALGVLVAALATRELATALPHYLPAASLPGRCLAQFVNDNAALTYLAPLAIRPPVTVNGMAYALRTATLRRIGGFAAIERQLTDDLAIADLVRAHGGSIAQTAAPVAMATHVATWARYFAQMHRWMLFATLLVRRQSLATNVLIAAIGVAPPLLLWATLLGTALAPGLVTIGTSINLLAMRHVLLRIVQCGQAPAIRAQPFVSIVVELLQPAHLLHACVQRTVRWRTRRYRVHDVDHFEPV